MEKNRISEQVKAAWHKSRGRKNTKLPLHEDPADPVKITGYKSQRAMKPGMSLKEWARIQVQTKTEFETLCQDWFNLKEANNFQTRG